MKRREYKRERRSDQIFLKAEITVGSTSDVWKKSSYKIVLIVGFKCGLRNGTIIIEELDRRNDVNREKSILIGHVL